MVFRANRYKNIDKAGNQLIGNIDYFFSIGAIAVLCRSEVIVYTVMIARNQVGPRKQIAFCLIILVYSMGEELSASITRITSEHVSV